MQETISTPVKTLTDKIYTHQKSDQTLVEIEQGYLRNARLPDHSFESFKKNQAIARKFVAEIYSLRNTKTSTQDEIMLDVLQYICESDYLAVDDPHAEDYYWLGFQVTPYSCFFPKLYKVLSEFQINSTGDATDYLNLLEQYPTYVKEIRERFIGQAEHGIRLPKEAVTLALPMLERLRHVEEYQRLYLNEDRLSRLEKDAEYFRKRAQDAVDQVVKEIGCLIDCMDDEYQSLAPQAVGLCHYPAGEAYYRLLVKQRTTLDISPEEVHQIGLQEVQKTEARMRQIRESLGYTCSREEFQKIIDADSRFRSSDAAEVGARLTGYLEKIKPVMDKWFKDMPQAECEVQRLDPKFESSITFGYYLEPSASNPKGVFYYNGANEVKKSQIGAASLVYHELLPGHHYQVSRVFEDNSLHKLRKNFFLTGYLEGWAEYAADLAGEMGMYDDLYDEYGRLIMVLFMASRLVVDTGLNVLGWTREEAAVYLKERFNLTDHMIFTETLRYGCDFPAQALGYRLCSLEFHNMRVKAQQILGKKFDIRTFHDTLLRHGVLPLNILGKHVDRYIESNSA